MEKVTSDKALESLFPTRSPEARASMDILFDGINCVHFYVEDSEQENLYYCILSKLFAKVNPSNIFPLNGKSSVLRHAQDENGNRHIRSPRVYIVDKDFDDLLGKMIVLPNVFYLKKFCIENYLLTDKSLIECAISINPKHNKRPRIESIIKSPSFIEQAIKQLDVLYRVFFLIQKFDLEIPNTKLAAGCFTKSQKDPSIDPQKVQIHKEKLRQALNDKGIIANAEQLEKLQKTAFGRSQLKQNHVSGKFLMQLFRIYITKHTSSTCPPDDTLRYTLASYTNKSIFRELRNRIRKYLKTQSVSLE